MVMERKYHRVGFTAAQSAELWERWKKGEGLKAIGRVLGKPHSCIWAHLRPSLTFFRINQSAELGPKLGPHTIGSQE